MTVSANHADTVEYYRKFCIQTAPRNKSIYLLHEKCTHLLIRARGYRDKRRELLDRAQNILAQFQASLIEGDLVSDGLFFVYDYCYALLDNNDDESIRNALALLSPLKNTFFALLKHR